MGKEKKTRRDLREKKAKRSSKHKKHKEKDRKKHKSSGKKRKRERSSDSDSSSSSGSSSGLSLAAAPASASAAAASASAAPGLSFADLYPMPKRQTGLRGSASIGSFAVTSSELQQRAERAERFVESAAEKALREHRAASAQHASSTHGGKLRGHSQELEKSYKRLTSLPNAADVRPLPVLRQAFELVQQRWASERDYSYACDMLKSIRQDLTVQNLGLEGAHSRFATGVYEAHARIALEAGDLGEFGACQAALVPLHAGRHSPHAMEFVSYRLLHAASQRGHSLGMELPGILGALPPKERSSSTITSALRVAVALNLDDFGTVLREVPFLDFLGPALLRGRMPQLRERAFRALCKAYSPTLPLEKIAASLGFGKDLRACMEWLRSLGTVPYATNDKSDLQIDTRQAAKTLAQREEALARAAAAETSSGAPHHAHGAPGRDSPGPAVPLQHLFPGGVFDGNSW